MNPPDFPEPPATAPGVAPRTLAERIDAGEPVTLLDTRAPSTSAEWRIEGPTVTTVNVPYWEFLDDPDESVFADLPDDERLTVLCAKGESSRYVAGILADRGYDVEHLDDGMEGWAALYDAVELDPEDTGGATVVQYQRPSSGCLAYIVVDGDEAAVIDPLRAFTDRYAADAAERGAEVVYAIDTHVHADHVSGVRTLATETGATPVLPEPAVARGVEYDVDYETVADGDELRVGDTTIDVIHTPGHTSGMTSYRVGNVLCTGDGLFTESVARPDLEEGDDGAPEAARQLYDTLQERVLTLPEDTLVAPAHFSDAATPAGDGSYTARIGDLVESMAALSMDRDEFVEYVLSDMPPRPANYEEIIAANLGQQDLDDDTAFELELGPNNCAASQDAMTGD